MLNEKAVWNNPEAEAEMFDEHLCGKGDLCDHAAFDLIKALLNKDADTDICGMPDPEWDIDLLAQIVEAAEEILRKAGLPVCRPYHDDEVPCYKCGECTSPDCPFKKTRNSHKRAGERPKSLPLTFHKEKSIMNTYHRFELAFDGEPQGVGFMTGLEDVGLPTHIESQLHQPFDDTLESPIIRSMTHEPVEFWFTDLGLHTFWPAICDIARVITEYDWSLLYLSEEKELCTAVYCDPYQAAWIAPAEPRYEDAYREITVSDLCSPLAG